MNFCLSDLHVLTGKTNPTPYLYSEEKLIKKTPDSPVFPFLNYDNRKYAADYQIETNAFIQSNTKTINTNIPPKIETEQNKMKFSTKQTENYDMVSSMIHDCTDYNSPHESKGEASNIRLNIEPTYPESDLENASGGEMRVDYFESIEPSVDAELNSIKESTQNKELTEIGNEKSKEFHRNGIEGKTKTKIVKPLNFNDSNDENQKILQIQPDSEDKEQGDDFYSLNSSKIVKPEFHNTHKVEEKIQMKAQIVSTFENIDILTDEFLNNEKKSYYSTGTKPQNCSEMKRTVSLHSICQKTEIKNQRSELSKVEKEVKNFRNRSESTNNDIELRLNGKNDSISSDSKECFTENNAQIKETLTNVEKYDHENKYPKMKVEDDIFEEKQYLTAAELKVASFEFLSNEIKDFHGVRYMEMAKSIEDQKSEDESNLYESEIKEFTGDDVTEISMSNQKPLELSSTKQKLRQLDSVDVMNETKYKQGETNKLIAEDPTSVLGDVENLQTSTSTFLNTEGKLHPYVESQKDQRENNAIEHISINTRKIQVKKDDNLTMRVENNKNIFGSKSSPNVNEILFLTEHKYEGVHETPFEQNFTHLDRISITDALNENISPEKQCEIGKGKYMSTRGESVGTPKSLHENMKFRIEEVIKISNTFLKNEVENYQIQNHKKTSKSEINLSEDEYIDIKNETKDIGVSELKSHNSYKIDDNFTDPINQHVETSSNELEEQVEKLKNESVSKMIEENEYANDSQDDILRKEEEKNINTNSILRMGKEMTYGDENSVQKQELNENVCDIKSENKNTDGNYVSERNNEMVKFSGGIIEITNNFLGTEKMHYGNKNDSKPDDETLLIETGSQHNNSERFHKIDEKISAVENSTDLVTIHETNNDQNILEKQVCTLENSKKSSSLESFGQKSKKNQKHKIESADNMQQIHEDAIISDCPTNKIEIEIINGSIEHTTFINESLPIQNSDQTEFSGSLAQNANNTLLETNALDFHNKIFQKEIIGITINFLYAEKKNYHDKNDTTFESKSDSNDKETEMKNESHHMKSKEIIEEKIENFEESDSYPRNFETTAIPSIFEPKTAFSDERQSKSRKMISTTNMEEYEQNEDFHDGTNGYDPKQNEIEIVSPQKENHKLEANRRCMMDQTNKDNQIQLHYDATYSKDTTKPQADIAETAEEQLKSLSVNEADKSGIIAVLKRKLEKEDEDADAESCELTNTNSSFLLDENIRYEDAGTREVMDHKIENNLFKSSITTDASEEKIEYETFSLKKETETNMKVDSNTSSKTQNEHVFQKMSTAMEIHESPNNSMDSNKSKEIPMNEVTENEFALISQYFLEKERYFDCDMPIDCVKHSSSESENIQILSCEGRNNEEIELKTDKSYEPILAIRASECKNIFQSEESEKKFKHTTIEPTEMKLLATKENEIVSDDNEKRNAPSTHTKKNRMFGFLKKKSKDAEDVNLPNIATPKIKIQETFESENNSQQCKGDETQANIKEVNEIVKKKKIKSLNKADHDFTSSNKSILSFLFKKKKPKPKEETSTYLKAEDFSKTLEETKTFIDTETKMYEDSQSLSIGNSNSYQNDQTGTKPEFEEIIESELYQERGAGGKSTECQDFDEEIREPIDKRNNINSSGNDESDIDVEEYTAFDFINEELKTFEETRLPHTSKVDSSITVETIIETIDDDSPKEIVTKKIFITEKLVQGKDKMNDITSQEILKKLIDANGELKAQLNSEKIKESDNENIQTSSMFESHEKDSNDSEIPVEDMEKNRHEIIGSEFVERNDDVQLRKSKMEEDALFFEEKDHISKNWNQEIVTDLDDIVSDESSPRNSQYIIQIHKTQADFDSHVSSIEGNTSKNFKSEDPPMKGELRNQQSIEENINNRYSITKFNDQGSTLSDAINVTEDFIKNLKMEYLADTEKEMITKNVHENKESKYCEGIDDSRRKPLFRIESEEENSTSRAEMNLSTSKNEEMNSPFRYMEIDEVVKTSERVDIETIEKKLCDLGKALETLELLNESQPSNKHEVRERKLRRIEKKFERMALENNENQNVEFLRSPKNEQYQQLVSQLDQDEVMSFQGDYNNLWDEFTFSKTDEWDSKTPDSQADVVELPQGRF